MSSLGRSSHPEVFSNVRVEATKDDQVIKG